MEFSRKVPSLVELCTQTAIANLRYMGDVGDMDLDLLKDILPHCNIDQLTHIENSTEGRDLSPVTDGLWKRFYEQQFGSESTNIVIKRMKQKKIVFKWRLLYEAKLKEREEAQNRMAEKLKQRYAESQATFGIGAPSSIFDVLRRSSGFPSLRRRQLLRLPLLKSLRHRRLPAAIFGVVCRNSGFPSLRRRKQLRLPLPSSAAASPASSPFVDSSRLLLNGIIK